jgi:hypothetical protein|nr:MAG TPA: chromosome segregation protein [Caudoviricetes sp.]
MSFDYTTTWRAIVGDEGAFIDHIKSTMTAVLDWRASKTGQSYTAERNEVASIPTSVTQLLSWITEKHKARVNGLVIGKLWGSPEFPLYNVLHRYPAVGDRTPVNLVGSDIELWVLDGAADIGWVKRPIRSMFNGSLSTKAFRGAPVMILCRSKHYTPKRGLNENETIENTAKLIKTLVLEYCAYGAIGDEELQALDTTPFVNPVGQTPPSFLDAYVKQTTFNNFRAEAENGISNIQHAVTTLSGDVEAIRSSTSGLDVLKNQVAVNKQGIFTLNTQVEYNANQIHELQAGLSEDRDTITRLKADVEGSNLITDSIRNEFSGIRSEQTVIKREIRELKDSHLNPDDFVTKTSFWSAVEQMPTTQGMRQEIRQAMDDVKTEVGENHYTKQESDGRFATQRSIDTKVTEATSGLASIAVVDVKVRAAVQSVTSDVETSYVKKTEVADLKKLQEQLGKVDVSSFATRSQLAQQQQTIEDWSNQRFELKGAAANLIGEARRGITAETDSKVSGISGRINAAVKETDELRKSTRQNLDALSGTVSAMDTRLTGGINNLRSETDTKINNRMPKLPASDGMLMVAHNDVYEKWKASHYSLSVDNLIRERDEGFILNGTGRMTDGTGSGTLAYATLAFNGSSGSFMVPADISSDRNVFFGDRIKIKEPVFKFSFDAFTSGGRASKTVRFNIRWFDRSGREMTFYARRDTESIRAQPKTVSTWVVAPSHAVWCEVGVVAPANAPQLYITNVKVQFAHDIPAETVWRFAPSEKYRPEGGGENNMWMHVHISSHNHINVRAIVHNPSGIPTDTTRTASTALPSTLAHPYISMISPYGGIYLTDFDGLKLQLRFNSPPPYGTRLGSSFASLADARVFPYGTLFSTVPQSPMLGQNNDSTTGWLT